MESVTLQDARAHLGQLLNRASHGRESITITRYGRPEGVLISSEAYAELQRLRRERDRREIAEAVDADARGEIDWVRYEASTAEELHNGLDEALDLQR